MEPVAARAQLPLVGHMAHVCFVCLGAFVQAPQGDVRLSDDQAGPNAKNEREHNDGVLLDVTARPADRADDEHHELGADDDHART